MALAAQSNALAIGGSLVLPGLLIPALQKEDEFKAFNLDIEYGKV